MKLRIFVEGGGDRKDLEKRCREGFRSFLEKAGVSKDLVEIFPSGTRSKAYRDFRTAIRNGDRALLLVDSEDLIDGKFYALPWQFLAGRPDDQWQRPDGAEDRDCHLMVVKMESWFFADRETLQSFFGKGFKEKALPSNPHIDEIPPQDIEPKLKSAMKDCQKGEYNKGRHSFDLLERIDPTKVAKASPWAKRLLDHLRAQGA